MLIKKYTICGKEIELKNSAWLVKLYRAMFNADLLVDTNTVFTAKERTAEYCDIVEQITYTMAVHADDSIGSLQEFLESFDSGLFVLQAVSAIMDLWVEGAHMTTEPAKKKAEKRPGRTTARSSSSGAKSLDSQTQN